VAFAPTQVWNIGKRSPQEDRNVFLCGFADLTFYVLIVALLVAFDRGLFGLWTVIAPLGFLMTCVPIGPVSAAYWSGARAVARRSLASTLQESELQFIEARMVLKALECETVKLESEVLAIHPQPELIHRPLRCELDKTRDLRSRIEFEIVRVDGQLSYIQDAKRVAIVCGSQ
jgi:hypothetical protein